MSKIIEDEIKTARVMIEMFCKGHHGQDLCGACRELMNYVTQKLEKCPHVPRKPACAKCEVHCYNPQMRSRIREVMRFAGPRMMYRHPVLAFRHMRDK
jgi:hypothetical protein